MTNSIGNFLGIAFIGLLLYSYFGNDWIEYKCVSINSDYEMKVSLYKKGGVIEDSELGTFKWHLELVEGTKYKSYVHPTTGSSYFSLNMEDLTFRYMLYTADTTGQCKKVGFFKSLENGAFENAEGIE